MKKRTSSLPILVLVAVVALVLGSFGTATAAGLTKGKVKAIATKVVNKKAATLSVAFAASAGTASNSNALGGQAASAYQSRAVFASSIGTAGVNNPAGATAQLLGPISITVPAGQNFVRVDASTDFFGPNGAATMWYSVDQPCTTFSGFGFDRRVQAHSDPTNGDAASVHTLQPMTGTHQFTLCGNTTAATLIQANQLLVETVALNGTGGTTRPTGGSSAPASSASN